MAVEVKNLPANAEGIRDMGSILGLERSPGGGHGNPLQYSCLENPMDRGARWATVHKVAKSDMTEATWQSTHIYELKVIYDMLLKLILTISLHF